MSNKSVDPSPELMNAFAAIERLPVRDRDPKQDPAYVHEALSAAVRATWKVNHGIYDVNGYHVLCIAGCTVEEEIAFEYKHAPDCPLLLAARALGLEGTE